MADSKSKLPFDAEYAKSNKSKCRLCQDFIIKEKLRLALMVQSPYFDGMQPNWYHFDCFWKVVKGSVKSTADIGHFDALRWDDQEKIRERISASGTTAAKAKGETLEDFAVEYAKSNRSVCKACGEKINKNDVRINYKSSIAAAAKGLPGTMDTWHHLNCFVKPDLLATVQWRDTNSVDKIDGYKRLKTEDQKLMKEKFPTKRKARASVDEPDSKKAKVVDEEKEKLKAQSNFVWKIRDELKKSVAISSLKELLTANGLSVPAGESKILDRAADCMAFGPTKRCMECDNGQFALTTGGYQCQGNMSSWTKCTVFLQDVKRGKLIIPQDLDEEYLTKFKFKAYNGGKRIFPKEEAGAGPSGTKKPIRDDKNPLLNLDIASAGKLDISASAVKDVVKKLGGTYVNSVSRSTACVVSNAEEVDKMSSKIKSAKKCGVHVVALDFLTEIEKGGDVVQLIPKHSIASWGSDVEKRIGKDETDSMASLQQASYKSSGFGRAANKSAASGGVKKVQLKGGAAVDPESGLEDTAHVLKESGLLFSATLGMVDVTRGSNSYYKLQLLESDGGSRYWVFRSWGRVGTGIGGKKVESFGSRKSDARRNFVDVYTEKTGNPFGTKNFEKIPHRFYPLDIDYGDDDEIAKLGANTDVESKLHPQIQNLMKLIFDIDTLKKTMVEFEIDMDKMPLGKLSRSQIQNAYSVLTELQTLIEAGNASRNAMLDATNRFFTLIPHNFGFNSIPLLDTLEVIQLKTKMLDSLLEIEVAYSLLKASQGNTAKSPIDANYEKLKCLMEVVDKDSDEFKMIETYTKNTHGATHSAYKLKVEEVFRLDRDGEKSRYKPFQKLHNRMLLWHGSRLSNFCGILSQGLRIAPPEAPATGYMFGKGVYFADMVSKSANYCFTNRSNPTGLMLLCEVAIGNMHELTHSSYITQLPSGKHSTKGIGGTYPDPAGQVNLENGTIVPSGIARSSSVYSSLLYNEYIVYDVAQIRMKYLIKMKFVYN
ncbi:poly [ADP-ribose] polymerase 1-like isoform X2 [Acanthaster planci]|uniref:Poly [ADP-ribose] polymerase n=1 Tax=Acanthaster planci TaxID=133434 RepID=A0A8B7YD94_ACAPL|nr:poly [ADP-ribose] polymerase 1-like isoform X2 [Acanthaster planci]